MRISSNATLLKSGQIYFLDQNHASAISDFQTSIDFDPDFVYAHIQLAVAHYRVGDIEKSE